MRQFIGGLLLLLSLVITGCLEDPTTQDLTADELTRQGWEYFMKAVNAYPLDGNSDYCKAVEKFDLAVYTDPEFADAYNGLGWAYLRINLFAEAYINFERGLRFASGEVRREMTIGLASALLQENNIQKATFAKNMLVDVVYGLSITTIEGDELPEDWTFSRDAAITDSNVHMNLAWAYLFTSRNYATDAEKLAIIGVDTDASNSPTAWGQYNYAAANGEIDSGELLKLYNALVMISGLAKR